MNKAIAGLVVVGAVIGLRPVARRIGHKMREHCEQMMAGQFGARGEADLKMRERCEEMAARAEGRHQEAPLEVVL